MAIKFKLMKKRDMKGGMKFYPQVVNNGNITYHNLCKEIAEQSSLTIGDVKNCLDRLSYALAGYLANGQNVSLGELGSFGILAKGNGVSVESDFRTNRDMRRPSVRYFPGKRIREAQDNATYERVKIMVDGSTQPAEPEEDIPEIV